MAQQTAEPFSMPSVGFIGLGNMGFGIAMNVRKRLPPSSKLVVCELDKARRDEFIQQAKEHGVVENAETPKEIAERCVRLRQSNRYLYLTVDF